MASRHLRAAVALLVVVGLAGLLWVEVAGAHTDDGCATEIHCLACRTAFVRAASASLAIDAPPALVALYDVVVAHEPGPHDVAAQGLSSRGPPPSR